MDTQYETLFAAARRAGAELARTDDATLSRAVVKAAALLRENTERLLAANALDLAAMAADSPLRDRLRLTPERIAGIASDMESVRSAYRSASWAWSARRAPTSRPTSFHSR